MVPKPFSMRLLHAKHRWMTISEVTIVHFQKIPPQARANDSLLQRIIRGEKSGVRLEHLGDGE